MSSFCYDHLCRRSLGEVARPHQPPPEKGLWQDKQGFMVPAKRDRKALVCWPQPETRGLRLRFQPVGLTGRRVEPTARKERRPYPRSRLGVIQEICGLAFQAVGLTGRRAEPTPRREYAEQDKKGPFWMETSYMLDKHHCLMQ